MKNDFIRLSLLELARAQSLEEARLCGDDVFMYWESEVANNDLEISRVEEVGFETRRVSSVLLTCRKEADLSFALTLCFKSPPLPDMVSSVRNYHMRSDG